MIDHSDNPTVIQYAVQDLFKGKSLATAAKNTAAKLSRGGTNMFIDSSGAVIHIDAKKLEDALMQHVLASAIEAMKKFKIGMEGVTVSATIRKFSLGKKDAIAFHKALIDVTGPLPGDDMSPEQIIESIKKWG